MLNLHQIIASRQNIASYPGSSPGEKWGESLEDLIMCPVPYYVWFFDNQIIAHAVRTDTAVVVVLNVTETTDRPLKESS